jgi:hypothetical protein
MVRKTEILKSVKYILEFRPLASSITPEIRLRQLLKVALRRFDLRCTDHRELPADEVDDATKVKVTR